MDTIPRNDFILRNRYDAFCKAVLRNEAKDYLHEMGRQRDREKSLDALTLAGSAATEGAAMKQRAFRQIKTGYALSKKARPRLRGQATMNMNYTM